MRWQLFTGTDDAGPSFKQAGATNDYHERMGMFTLTGVEIPTPGDWELTGRYGDAELSFAIWTSQ